jgi:uncharacterized protein YegP (UPF0339 family)
MWNFIKGIFGRDRYIIRKSDNGEWGFILKAANGETIGVSEAYERKAGAENGVASVRKHASDYTAFELRRSTDERHYFVLKADNGEIILVSETYDTKAGARKGIDTVMRASQTERVDYKN